MQYIRYIFTFLLLNAFTPIFSQIYGVITDENNQPLPYATIIIKGTSIGVNSNSEGKYELALDKGKQIINFQYVGYKTVEKEIDYIGKKMEINVQLNTQNVEINEIVIKANAEDPAYAVIRKAIEKRDFYLNEIKNYTCEAYVKGIQKVKNVPKKMMGKDIGTLGGILDTSGTGIVYLSESISKYYFKAPNDKKEEMISSKISGTSTGFSFNRATPLQELSFYNNYITIGRKLLSPIGDGALNYYKYKLLGFYYDENGLAINKIEVMPKRSEDPIFRGIIYIVDNEWNIHSTELYATSSATKVAILDTFWIKQIHRNIGANKWRLFSQTIDIGFNILGIGLKANYSGTFTNYNLNPQFDNKTFSNEIFKVNKEANKKDTSYWSTTRPVTLTTDEQRDYVKKDSLNKIWTSKPYMDSVDRADNKFKLTDLILGYSYENSYKRWSVGTMSLLNSVQFNPMQGYNIGQTFYFNKNYNDDNLKWWKINVGLNYGFSDNNLRLSGNFTKLYNSLNYSKLKIFGGYKDATQFNSENKFNLMLNSYYCLVEKLNLMKLYEKSYIGAAYSREIGNGLFVNVDAEYANRSPMYVTTHHSLFNKVEVFEDNVPFNLDDNSSVFKNHNALISSLELTYKFNQKYSTTPDQKINRPNKMPFITLKYIKGWKLNNTLTDFDHLNLTITQEYLPVGLLGNGSGSVKFGFFPRKNNMLFIDFAHFNGNSNTPILHSFLRLYDFYFSTTKPYTEAHYAHHFEGYFLDKIPLVKKLKWKEIVGFSNVWSNDLTYSEISLGFENVGYGLFRFFKFHIVGTFVNTTYAGIGIAVQANLK